MERRSDVIVFVEVTLRITPYTRAHRPAEPVAIETHESVHAIAPSSAPAEKPDAWSAGRAWWVQRTVPITRGQDGQLVVDRSLVAATASGQLAH